MFLARAILLSLAVVAGGRVAEAQTFGTLAAFSTASGVGQTPTASLIQGSDGYLYGTTYGGGGNSKGTVFRIDSAGNLTILHSFGATASDGQNPYASLIQASDGDFYGTTFGGGINNKGTAFKMDSAGNITILHAFGATSTDGQNPYAPLIQASDGNLYGTTLSGGAYSGGTVFQIDSAGSVNVLHSFNGNGDGSSPYGGLVQGADGSLYGTTWSGGINNKGTVFKLNTSGAFTQLYAFAGKDGSYPVATLLLASDGNFYGTTQYGGPGYTSGLTGHGTIFRIDSAGHLLTMYSFGVKTGDGNTPSAPLIQASDGLLYGVTSSGGAAGDGAVFKMDLNGSVLLLHSFNTGGLDGQSPQGGLLQADDHSFYGTCSTGGAGSAGTLFRIKRGQGFDANNDGYSDILFRNTSTGDVTLWEMNGLSSINQGFLAQGVSLNFQVVGAGDFNGDGFSDVLFRNTNTGDVYLWELVGLNIGPQGYLAQGLPLVWQTVGIGDFNGDCKSDILWRNTSTGDVVLWQMNGTTVATQSFVQKGLPLVWQVAGVGDFNGAGRADVLWRNTVTGDVVEWQMNGATISSQSVIAAGLPLVWQVVGIGDFNGDGLDDILWRNTHTGDVVLWEMNGTTITSQTAVVTDLPLVWQVAGVGDYNGDGQADVLWRNTSTGDVVLWEMDGAIIGSQGYIAPGLPLVWQIDAP
jgi:uncharacterized repeat protein (TIGR03803 family)